MAEILQPSSFDPINIIEKSELIADAAAAQAVISLQNPDNYVANVFVVVGTPGAENAELRQVQSISGQNATLTANLTLKHYIGEPVTILYGDKIQLYRAANVDGTVPADGDFAALGSAVAIEADQNYVEYSDTSGGSDYWYKKSYYNSYNANETELSQAVAIRGGNYGHYTTVDAVRFEAGLTNNRYISNSDIFAKLLQAESEVNGSLSIGGYTLPIDPVPYDVVNATNLLAAGYLLSVDYGPEHEGTLKDGKNKIAMARDILKRIENGELTLVDSTGTTLPKSQVSGVAGYPDNTAAYLTPSEAPMFRVTDRL